MSLMNAISNQGPAEELQGALADAARKAMGCSLFCTICADACAAAPQGLEECILACRECADTCAATSWVAVRRTGRDPDVIRGQLQACIWACEACARVCDRHKGDYCALCAKLCRECGEGWAFALTTLH